MGAKRLIQCVSTLAAILLFPPWIPAQTVVDPSHLPATVRNLDPSRPHELLPCTVRHIEPTLNFGLQLETGYVLQIPLSLYRGTAHHWDLVFRVTPENNTSDPVYFTDSVDIAANSRPESTASIRGLFLVGPGRYDMSFSLLDDSGRVCREKWTVDAGLSRNDRATEAMLEPGAVTGISLPSARMPLRSSGASARRITVVLDTLPAAPRIVQPGKPDGVEWLLDRWGKLLSMLTALLEQLPADSVRVVALDIVREDDVFRQDGFTLADIHRLVHAGDVKDEEPIANRPHQNPTAIGNFLASEANREVRSEPPSTDLIFLGTPTGGKLPAGFRVNPSAAAPRLFYLQYLPNQPGRIEEIEAIPSESRTPDFISQSMLGNTGSPLDIMADYVRRRNGKTFNVSSASDLNTALKKINLALRNTQ